MENIKPLSPKDILTPQKRIHSDIIEIVNELINQKFDGTKAIILQNNIVDLFMQKHPEFVRQSVFDKGYLDFEDFYRKVGWQVEYDKPGFNEKSYEARFIFTI